MLARGDTHAGALARPEKAPFPRRGKTCGRRERGAGTTRRKERSFWPVVNAAVESTWSTGGRRPSRGVGRTQISVGWSRAQRFLRGVRAHRRQRVLFGTPRRGTSSVHAQKCVGNRYEGVATHSHKVTRPLLGPEARTRQSWLNAPAGNRRAVTRSQQHRGRVSPRKWEEPAPGLRRNGRSAARRVSPFLARELARYVRKGRRLRPSSLRGVESRGRSARTS